MRPVHLLQFWGYRTAAALASVAPARVSYGLAASLARCLFSLGGKRVRYARTNLRLALPERSDEERERVGKESFVHLAWTLLDILRMDRWSEEDLAQRIRLVGKENLDAALAQGKGVILLGLHIGSFELGAPLAPRKMGPVAWISRPFKNEYIDRHFKRFMTRTGCSLIDPRGASGESLRELRNGGMVGILNDQYTRPSRGGIDAPFFGVRCSTSPGVAVLALRTGAPVLPTYMTRDGIERHTATIDPPVLFERGGSLRANVSAATTACNRAYQAIIERNPDQYLWTSRRFRDGSEASEQRYRRSS